MLFSICIPSYNRANLVRRTIDSLSLQSFKDFEVLLIDDGSTDNTREVIDAIDNPNLKYIYKENGGKHSALNVGIENACGELFLVLDSDDVLLPNALEVLAEKWKSINNNHTYCGIMGRCSRNGHLIGIPFADNTSMSYIEFHYGAHGGKYGDCCECIRTEIMKKYRWPEDRNTKFVPEAYVMDQIGLDYILLCTNEILEEKEYLENGITKSGMEYKKNNCVGYLYNYVSKIDVICKKRRISLRNKIGLWNMYWRLVRTDVNNLGPRVSQVTFLGIISKCYTRVFG